MTTEAVSRPGEYLHPSAEPDFDLDRATRHTKRYCDELQDEPARTAPLVRSALRAAMAAGGAKAEHAVRGFRRGNAILSSP